MIESVIMIFELYYELLKPPEERAYNTFDEFFVLILVLKD
jgi:phosphatidylserine decarboxylase